MGNLAHELKRVLQRLHLLRDALPPSLQAECDEALAQIRHLTDRELKRARIAGSPHPGRRFTPKQDLPHLAELLQRIYPDMRLEMQFEDSIELPFDRDDMLELIGNLLDNACKFGSTKAALSLTLSKGQLALEILNDGAQIAESSRTRILERGVRIDESIAGHGLGLSICNMIVDSYNGELEIRSATSEGGYSVSVMVRLPLR
jgi:signal transduction histidine kinase